MAHKDLGHYKEIAEMLQSENMRQQNMIEDLEMKNRLLVDKLNNQIYMQATAYKEKTMNALMNGSKRNEGRSNNDSQSPIQPGRGVSNNLGLSGNNDSAFARSPLQQNKKPGYQPTYTVRQDLERLEKPSETNSRPQSFSPLRNRSNSPSRTAAALQDSRGVGGSSYLNRSPLDFGKIRGMPGSPLRQKSPPRENFYQPPPPIDENFARMKKSCERIAAVLGIKEGTDGRIIRRSIEKSIPNTIHKSDVQTSDVNRYTNMNNPSGVRGISTREEDGQPSGYKSLREKSPVRKSKSPPKKSPRVPA